MEVSEEGTTTSHVFRGSVKVQVVSDEGRGQDAVLRENESARVEWGEGGSDLRLTRNAAADDPPKFARRIYEPPKLLDLLDIVAGGNGTSNRRGCGIDPATGRRDTFIADSRRVGDGQYWPVVWSRMIDGVFVPDGWLGAVQVDSAEDTFDGFPKTSGRTWGPLWARATDDVPIGPDDDANNWIHLMDRGERFTPERRGLLCLHANAGITFDIEAVRRMYRTVRPARFQATAGMIDSSRIKLDADGQTDLWIIVDGRLKMKRIGLRRQDGAMSIDVELGPRDRFLTLAATDGGDGITADWVVFGDPVLRMTSTRQEEK
ncbi:MAG: NPCBM/NEW2 domain-containing protein [Pirellulales bacterium]|nr:NPCBM/NEW2 domain-containing protein [Pirellulales bacterium]